MNEIEIENLMKRYGKVVALNGVSLRVGPGEILGLLGPNGAGKSTLMKIIVGVLSPTSGSVKVGGNDVVKDPETVKRMVGYLPESPSLYTTLTVKEFLRFVGKIRDVQNYVLKDRISETLLTFSLKEKKDALVGTLSKGIRQKVALIAAMLHDPEVLVLDEPLTSLDPKSQVFVNDWITSPWLAGCISRQDMDKVPLMIYFQLRVKTLWM